MQHVTTPGVHSDGDTDGVDVGLDVVGDMDGAYVAGGGSKLGGGVVSITSLLEFICTEILGARIAMSNRGIHSIQNCTSKR